MERPLSIPETLRVCVSGITVLTVIYITSFHNFLLFHSLTELFSIIIASGIFIVAWNARRIILNNYLLFLGIAYLFTALLDSLHTLSYKGMGVFQGHGPDLPTQLWIAARLVESISLFIAPLLIYRKMKVSVISFAFSTVFVLLLVSIFYWDIFPVCYLEGSGLTPFKKISEYVVCLVLTAAVFLLYRKKDAFDPAVFLLLAASISVTIASEIAFTFYFSVYSPIIVLGHFLKIISFYLIYKALIETGLMHPYNLLFRDLKKSEEALGKSESNYRNLTETTLVGIFKSKINGELCTANSALSEMFEYSSPEEMSGLNILSFYSNPRERKILIRHLKKHGKIDNFEADIITGKGKTRSVLLRAALKEHYITGTILDISDRKKVEQDLQQSLTEAKKREAEVTAMFEGAKAILEHQGFEKSARIIFDTCKTLIGATAGYVAVLSEDGKENEVLFLDSGGLSCTVDPDLPMPIRGLRAEAFSSNNTVYENDFMHSAWMKYIPEGHVHIENAMFAPLVLNKKSVALLGLANKPGGFTDRDARLAKAFSELAAIALHKSRTEEEESRLRARLEAQWKMAQAVDADEKTLSSIILRELISATESAYGWYGVMNEDESMILVDLWSESVMKECALPTDRKFPVSGGGLWADVVRKREPLILNNYKDTAHPGKKGLPEGHVGINNLLIIPVFKHNRIVAVGAVANKAGSYDLKDAEQMSSFLNSVQIIYDKRKNEAELKLHRENLMELVEERTVELQKINEKLEKEIMDRRNIENELRLMALFAELNPFPVLRFDINSRVLMLNQAAITIFNLDTGREVYLSDLLPDLANADLANCIHNGSVFSYSAQINDRTFHFTIIGIPSLHAGQLYGSDITEQKKAEAESMRVRHLASIGEFTAGVAHEINNPINGIINYTQILVNRLSPDSKEHDIAERIIREGDRIAEIIKSLLSFSSASNEKKRSVDVHEILTESIALTNTQLRKEHIRLSIDIPSDLPEIFAHPHQIEQVFMNLISNARYALNKKFPENSDGKVLEIKARETAVDNFSSIEIIFEDRGTGIPEEIMDRIMNPFFTTKPAGIGTGLGMSISHGIINDHGGKLVVESVEGEFTKIIIKLPSADKGSGNES